MNAVRIGVLGFGVIGRMHAACLLGGQVPRLCLAAVADVDAARLAGLPASVTRFTDATALLDSGCVDAVLVATPHFSHPPLAQAALRRGLHVLVEKPVAAHVADARRMLEAHTDSSRVFGVMFNQRTSGYFRHIRTLIRDGALGALSRVQWTITDWFRTDAYYASGGWRATWAGEGGGVLLNQAVHNLDLFWWLFGPVRRVRAHCHFGRHHAIEVEDEVTAYLELANGATAVFITSTGEAPGSNRLEIAGDRGRLVLEGETIRFTRNRVPAGEHRRTSPEPWGTPPTDEITSSGLGHGDQHAGILRNFADAILDGAPLIAPAAEGVHSLELANAMLYSTWTGATVELPLDAAAYEHGLQERIAVAGASSAAGAVRPVAITS